MSLILCSSAFLSSSIAGKSFPISSLADKFFWYALSLAYIKESMSSLLTACDKNSLLFLSVR